MAKLKLGILRFFVAMIPSRMVHCAVAGVILTPLETGLYDFVTSLQEKLYFGAQMHFRCGGIYGCEAICGILDTV